MLPIYINISLNVKKIINSNIRGIFQFCLDMCKDLSYEEVLSGVFPSFMIKDNFDKCKNALLDLNEMCIDEYERDYLKPLYEYTIFCLLNWWFDVTHENEHWFMEISEEDAISTDGMNLYKYLNNEQNYFDFLFQDWDFDNVNILFDIYKETPNLVSDFFDINLDDYVDLMPKDIKSQYFMIKGKDKKRDDLNNDEEYIVRSIYNTLSVEMLRPHFYEVCSEVDCSDTIRNALFFLLEERGLIIDREDRAGFALKDAGELDFYIWKVEDGIYKHIAVGENKKWGKYKDSITQLIGYMDNTIDFGFIIIFNQTSDLNTVREKQNIILNNFSVDGKFELIKEIKEIDKMKNVFVSIHENPEHKNTYFKIYHFIFNVYKPERKNAAKMARKKKE